MPARHSASSESPELSLPFDSYERYQVTGRIVRELWPGWPRRRPLRILDVGGHFTSLKYFLPEAKVVAIDLKEPPAFTYRETVPYRVDAYVRGAGGSLPFEDDSFDLVTAHDTLEHVPRSMRPRFLADLMRVSRRFVVLNGPMQERAVRRAEERVAEYWRRALGWKKHPLEEHLALGLPSRNTVEVFWRRARSPFVAIPNGNLTVWLAMMTLKHFFVAIPDTEDLHEMLDRTFNRLFADDDFGGTCYRVAYAVAKHPGDRSALRRAETAFPKTVNQQPPFDDSQAVLQLVDTLQRHAGAVRLDFGRLRATVAGLQEVLRAREEELAAREEVVAAKDQELAVREEEIAAKELIIRGKNAELRKKDAIHARVLASKESLIEREQKRIGEQQEELNGLAWELDTLRSSTGFRLFEGIRRRINRVFPPGSRRARPYAAMVRVLRRLLDRRRPSAPTEASPFDTPTEEYRWFVEATDPTPEQLDWQREEARRLAFRPTFSVVVPVWNPPLPLLHATVDSVRAQTYDAWELCIADGGSRSEVRTYLRKISEGDPRVRVRLLDQNQGISGNSNEALTLATGDFVAFLDHTDLLAPTALYEVARRLNRDATIDVITSDRDLISEDGERRFDPLFTPEWSPDTLLCVNYMAHLAVIRRRLIEEVGGLRPETDGAQDWDLLLRVTERTDRVGRIPAMLYHWRADQSSAVFSLDAKPYAKAAQEYAVADALRRREMAGRVERQEDGAIRLLWEPTDRSMVSILIPTKHNRELLSRCMGAISRSTYPRFEVIVVETAGRTPERERWYQEFGTQFPLRVLWWDGPFNYSAVNNLAAREASGDILLFLNDDTEPMSADWLEELVGWVERQETGVVGAQLIAPDGTIQHGGVVIGMGGFADHMFRGLKPGEWSIAGSTRWYRDVAAVTGACLMVRREVFEQVGGWDEEFLLCGGDVELCLRIRSAGYRVVWTPFAQLRHMESATRGSFVPPEDFATSYWHYQAYLHEGDPYYNPNLSLQVGPPRLRKEEDPSPLKLVSEVLGRDLVPRRGPSDVTGEAIGFSRILEATNAEIAGVRALHGERSGRQEVTSINWFIPDFESPFYGGIHTVFRFANHFLERHGVKSRFVVIGTGPEPFIRSGIRAAFPDLSDAEIYLAPYGSDEETSDVPWADVSIASLWVTCYPLLRFPATGKKFYFVQDFEPMFYPAGTVQALSEETYRMGLYGICNTPTLKEIYERQYEGKAISFNPAVDPIFHSEDRKKNGEPYTVFFYGRPGHPRNCYELAFEALHRLKEKLKDRVRIVTAGSWSGADDRMDAHFVDNLGLLNYGETAELYRRCDVGMALSVSKHPSYLPMQLMASGCLVVSNVNPASAWLLRDGENCLQAPPTAEALAGVLQRGLLDEKLRSSLVAKAAEDIDSGFRSWEPEMDRVFEFLCDPEA